MGRYIISLDQGTTSSRAVLYDVEKREIVEMYAKEFAQIYPKPGWVEHDATTILKTQTEVLKRLVRRSDIDVSQIACIGITNQRETTVLWDKVTGEPVYNAIVWQCRRTADLCNNLKNDGYEELIKDRTGLVIDAYFSGTKIKWIIDNVKKAKELLNEGRLLAGTIDSWLVYNMTKEKAHVTDVSNASRTMLYNIREMKWDKEILKILDISPDILPEVVDSSGVVGYLRKDILGKEIPISGIAGDQQSALFGQTCFLEGDTKNTYGTGCFILMNTKDKIIKSNHDLLTTVAWRINGVVDYALEGSVFNAGASIKWIRDELNLVTTAKESDEVAMSVEDTNGVYLVPAFTGLGAPYWDMYARGTIVGLTRGANRAHIVRATLESIAFQSRDVFEAMQMDSNIKLNSLKVDGGASNSPFIMQFQADLLNIEVKRPKMIETTALGSIYLAGLGVGVWKDKEELKNCLDEDTIFKPVKDDDWRERQYKMWKRAVSRSKEWLMPDEV